MAVTFNPFTGNLDFIDTTAAAGSDTEIQFNDGGKLAGDADLSWDTSGTTKVLGVGGDINLDDGGANTLTLQTVTPTAARTISFPDATGTVGLVAGSTTDGNYHSLWGGFLGAVPFVQDGALTVSNGLGYDEVNGILSVRGGFTTGGASTVLGATTTGALTSAAGTFSGRVICSVANAASAPAGSFTGTWFTTGTSTTTKPALLVEQSGATSTGWNATGTGFGVNSASTFDGRLLDLQKNGTTVFNVLHTGALQSKGDLNLDDGGSFTTTLQTVTATQNNTISFPNATGTVGLVGGSSGQLIQNLSGAYAGVSTLTADGSGNITLTGRMINSTNAAASAPASILTGTWFAGANNTSLPNLYVAPSAASVGTAWSTLGTGFGVNSIANFTGDLIHLLQNGTSRFRLTGMGRFFFGENATSGPALTPTAPGRFYSGTGTYTDSATAASGTVTHGAMVSIDNPAIAATNATVTYTNASSFYIDGAPTNGTNVTITNSYSFFVNAGASYFGGNVQIADTANIVLATGTGTKIGTATTQKLAFYNATPVVQPTAVANITTVATFGTLPTPDGSVTIADATTPTVTELLEYCVELEAKLEAALGHLRTLGLIAT